MYLSTIYDCVTDSNRASNGRICSKKRFLFPFSYATKIVHVFGILHRHMLLIIVTLVNFSSFEALSLEAQPPRENDEMWNVQMHM